MFFDLQQNQMMRKTATHKRISPNTEHVIITVSPAVVCHQGSLFSSAWKSSTPVIRNSSKASPSGNQQFNLSQSMPSGVKHGINTNLETHLLCGPNLGSLIFSPELYRWHTSN